MESLWDRRGKKEGWERFKGMEVTYMITCKWELRERKHSGGQADTNYEAEGQGR